ncbi:MAG TPA: peptidylprolyl isomerase [Epsilonproteobacteria bacterium]|nr:peptidylprolyl isomerase [Campylobacterota bacterium]HHD79279.1 peptidylprolyl isomerase [Campylobacterota bacterium]
MKKLFLGLVFLGLMLNVHADEVKKEVAKATVAKAPTVMIETNVGKIEVKLFPDKSPLAVENFLGLVKKGYYNGIIFHRVIKGFMIQGGDPTGTGRGGESLWHKEFKNEDTPNLVFDRPFLLAMANHGRNTNGSQFFITTVPTPHLNGGYTIFGEVIKGQDVVKKIENVSTGRGDRPMFPQTMKKVYIEK